MIAHLAVDTRLFPKKLVWPFNHCFFNAEQWFQKADSAESIIFDMDGTLINSDYANFLSYKTALETVVGPQPFLVYNPKIRLTRQRIQQFMPCISKNDLMEVIQEKERVYPFYLSETSINRDVVDVLRRCYDKELILSTNSQQDRAELLLSYHGLSNKFAHLFFSDDGKIGNKYQKVMHELSLDARRTVIFENENHEAILAREVGIKSTNIMMVGNE
ncbi:MAG: HAD hydrolase-like protein [Alcaligenaceae bacterium]|nr:HAD hydrolase-like protein [Alcaligenaceae bacterium]